MNVYYDILIIFIYFPFLHIGFGGFFQSWFYLGEAMLFEIFLEEEKVPDSTFISQMLSIFIVVLCLTVNYFVNRFVLLW